MIAAKIISKRYNAKNSLIYKPIIYVFVIETKSTLVSILCSRDISQTSNDLIDMDNRDSYLDHLNHYRLECELLLDGCSINHCVRCKSERDKLSNLRY